MHRSFAPLQLSLCLYTAKPCYAIAVDSSSMVATRLSRQQSDVLSEAEEGTPVSSPRTSAELLRTTLLPGFNGHDTPAPVHKVGHCLHPTAALALRLTPFLAQDLTLRDELGNLLLLVTLYMMQGVPLGLTMGSMYVHDCLQTFIRITHTHTNAQHHGDHPPPSPFLLQSNASYTQIGLFSLAAYPYSFKLLWSPIVDSVYWTAVGRRKSWIVPVQALSAGLMIAGASWLEARLQVLHGH